jgi:hypothetical protein
MLSGSAGSYALLNNDELMARLSRLEAQAAETGR